MKYNLLKMTQLILSSMDSDEVNSITDTTEAQQVVDVIETTYNDLLSTLDFPDRWTFFELEASLDVTRPTIMYLPDDVAKLEWVKYAETGSSDGTKADYAYVEPLSRELFFQRMNGLDSDDSDVISFTVQVGAEDFPVWVKNDRMPKYYTTFDDGTLLFDSWDSAEATTLVKEQTHCYGMKIPTFTRSDAWTAPLDARQFTLFFNEAKRQAFNELKQVANPVAEQRARRGWVQSGRKKARSGEVGKIKSYLPDYGRRSQK